MKSGGRFAFLALLLAGNAGIRPSFAGDIEGTVSVQGLKSAESIVVYVDRIAEGHPDLPSRHAEVHQKRLTFIPHVLPVVQGATVDFYNDDSVNHGVSWPAISGNKKLSHHLGVWAPGESRSFTFNDTGVVPLLCYLHPEMSAYIIVVPTPYFAVTDQTGKFVLKGVPAGDRVLKVWSEDGDPVTVPVHLTDARTPVQITVHRAHTR